MKKQIVQISFGDNNLVYILVSEQPEELDEFFKVFCDTSCFYASEFMKWLREHDEFSTLCWELLPLTAGKHGEQDNALSLL